MPREDVCTLLARSEQLSTLLLPSEFVRASLRHPEECGQGLLKLVQIFS